MAHTFIDAADVGVAKGRHLHLKVRDDGQKAVYFCEPRKDGGSERKVHLHRRILGVIDPKIEVDHINRDTLDNRRLNLRLATRKQNSQNCEPRNGTSPFRGVGWCRPAKKWRARVMLDGKDNHLGVFTREEDAAAAAAEFRRQNMPYATD